MSASGEFWAYDNWRRDRPEPTVRPAHSATTAEASRAGPVATTTNGSGHSAAPMTRSPASATALTLATAAPVARRLV